ncbi:TolC family protein [Brevundimonas abyssalis]|uniref:TolC family protein n=1 Tax=Brevundimonas abyssalis TaxID=1125965 RepID=UPI0024129E78|nr:TolC family protein [Brevundimonas abyssalis]
MVRRTRALASAAALALMAALAGPVSADSLQDAIALAYQTNPTLLAQRAQQRALDETYVQARAGLRPNIDASVGASYTRNYGDTASGGAIADIPVPIDTDGDGSRTPQARSPARPSPAAGPRARAIPAASAWACPRPSTPAAASPTASTPPKPA